MTNYLGLKTYYASIATKMLKSRGFKARTWKGQVKVTLPKGTTNFKIDTPNTLLSLVNLADSMFKPKEALYEEPPDAAIMNRSGKFPEEKLPEGYARYILPAGKNIGGKKVNIDRIKQWVQEVKMSGKTNEDILNEYNELTGRERITALSARQRHALAVSVALKRISCSLFVGYSFTTDGLNFLLGAVDASESSDDNRFPSNWFMPLSKCPKVSLIIERV